MSEQPAGPTPESGTTHVGNRSWLPRLSTYLASFACSVAVNELSGTFGYHGLAGAVALLGVVTAANWIRKLDPLARLSRYAPWLFLVPASCAATIAALSSGPVATILTVAAAILTVGAVLITRELQSAARLLADAALIVSGAAVILAKTESFTEGNIPLGIVIISGGVALIIGGVAHAGERDVPAGACLIFAGAAVFSTGIIAVATHAKVFPTHYRLVVILAIFWFGLGLVQSGVVVISGGRHGYILLHPERLKRYTVTAKAASASAGAILTAVIAGAPGTALIWAGLVIYFAACAVLAAAYIGPQTIENRVRQAINWGTKPPQAPSTSSERSNQPNDLPNVFGSIGRYKTGDVVESPSECCRRDQPRPARTPAANEDL